MLLRPSEVGESPLWTVDQEFGDKVVACWSAYVIVWPASLEAPQLTVNAPLFGLGEAVGVPGLCGPARTCTVVVDWLE